MIYNNISYSNWRKNNPPGFMPVVLPLPFQRKPKPLEPILVFDTDAVDRRDNLNIEQAPVDIETDAALSDLLARRAAVVLLNDFVLPFEAEQAEFVLSGNELDRTAKKVSASLVNLARYSSFSFDLMAVVNMTSNNWDELDTLYEYGETSYTEHINLGQRRAQKLFDFLWAAVNDRAVLNQELAVLPARQKTAAEANLRIVRANLLQLTDRAVALKLLPEYQKMCYVYDAGKGVAPPLRPEDKTPVYTYEQSLHGRNPRVGITGLVLAIVNPADQNVSQVWQDHGEATLAGLTETIAQEEKRLAEEAQEKARLEQERIALEEQQAEEAREIERLAQEEEKRLIEEAQEKARLEQERIALEEQQAEEAREIERLAQEEEKRLVEEAQAKAEEEARVKAEAEAQAKTEEEARVKAEEEARAEAEEEARIKAEEEARVKAEDEAKRKKLELTFSGGGVIKENEQAAWLQTTIMPRTFRPNIPGISSIKIGGGLNFSFHRKTERLAYRYLKPVPNVAPTANAGSDQNITLPTSSVTLDGNGSNDSDGSIASYEWTQVNGPATATIGSPAGSSTNISGLTTAGTYTFRLKVTDNDGADSTDDVIVTVNAAPPPPNVAPTANAGTDKNITLPTNSTALDGSASNDSDGSIASYEWTQVNGPVTATINTPTGSSTSISGLTTAGTYTFRLKVTDNDGAESTDEVIVIVNAAPPTPNVAPTANAGTDQSITLPTNSTTLDGSTSSDSDGNITAWEWTQVNGPVTATIGSPTGSSTSISGLTTAGTYTFRLKVTDDDGAESADEVIVIVNAAPPPPNVAPTANAGTDKNITLPTNSTTLDGSASNDSDGSIASYEWTQISKPAGAPDAVISSATGVTTNVSGLQEGTYTFRLKVTDNDGAENTDDVTVTVNAAPPPPNVAPTANAGTDKNITLPTNSTTLDGSASNDNDGSIVSYEWTQISKPASAPDAVISSATGATTNVSGLQEGTYTFRLKVTDDDGADSTDDVTVTVSAAPNVAPTANAGTDQNITLPTSNVTLDGNASSDDDGSIASYEWTQISKPASAPDAVISSATGATTNVSGLQEGTYEFQLKVIDDDGEEAVDTITITVNPQPTTTVYKDITITFSNLPAQNSNGHATLDLAHTISASGGWDANFQESDISSQITGSVDVSSYNGGDQVTITKEFYYDSQNIATLTITAVVNDDGFGGLYFDNVSYNAIGNPIQLSKTVPSPPLPSIMSLPTGTKPINTPLNDDLESPPFSADGYTLENPDFSAAPLRYIDDPDSPYALAEYFKNTTRFRILPHFDLEISGQTFETPLGSLTPFLKERFEIGVEFTVVDVEVAAAAPEAAVREIEDLAARDNAVRLVLANELQIFSTLDLRAIPGHLTAGLELQNRSYAEDRYSGSLKYLQDINYRALQSVSAKITGGFTQTGAGFWRGDILANLLPAAQTKTPRLTAGFNLFGENGAFGVGATVVWRPLSFMEYGFYTGFQDVGRLNSLYGALAAKIYF